MSDLSEAEASQLIRHVFEAQPQWLEMQGQVTYVRILGQDEPQPCFSPAAGKAFLRWLGAWGGAHTHAAAERGVEPIEAWEREDPRDHPIRPSPRERRFSGTQGRSGRSLGRASAGPARRNASQGNPAGRNVCRNSVRRTFPGGMA